ncbi:MAG: DNA mismatch repair endonuclease MutL [Saprospiraceae bacterium]|nr:DNA mismatch repair endonuclease MutL [Saprospiraceae bacterium]
MAGIIQLLPDSIANQIAAGEVIQRPASVIKELLENAIDAGASNIQVILKDAGKTLIQVIDDGKGISDTDARMAFERHATSKIKTSEDLFHIRTMGFRGEALASIAAIAQVELRSRTADDELGTRVVIEASEVKAQEVCQQPLGSNFLVKNLFYNVPARRNFLKSDSVEMKHILDEFQRVAIANPDVFFSLHHNQNELFHLHPGNLRQRLVGVFGNNSNKKLVPIAEETDVVQLRGFVGKPEFARKTRGDQFFFVNNRFIKSGYLHHAVMTAYEDILQDDTYPFYVIFIDIDPARIDINVHPTKQEIKFDDERLIYQYLRVAVRHALGQYAVIPTLDFEAETGLLQYQTAASAPVQRDEKSYAGGSSNQNWNIDRQQARGGNQDDSSQLQHWQSLYEGLERSNDDDEEGSITLQSAATKEEENDQLDSLFANEKKVPFQIHNRYIVSHIKSGFLLIDQQAAHERILFERYFELLQQKKASTQQELFPRTVKLATADAEILRGILEEVNEMGFDIQEFGSDTFVIHGIPSEIYGKPDAEKMLEQLIEQFKSNLELKIDITENLARAMAKSSAIKRGKSLTVPEMQELIDRLFACELPYKSPSGRNCFITYDLEELNKKFEG